MAFKSSMGFTSNKISLRYYELLRCKEGNKLSCRIDDEVYIFKTLFRRIPSDFEGHSNALTSVGSY